MTLNEKLSLYLPAVEEQLKNCVSTYLPSGEPEMEDMVAYHMGWKGEGAGAAAQGKHIRPILALLTAESAGGNWHSALPIAAAVELIHNFSLVHDDIQDQSPLRRGRPTVWAKWGIAQAINVGDILFALAQTALLDLPVDIRARISALMQKTCLRLTEGQYLDMSYEKKATLPLDAYWKMIGGKTASLLAFAVEAGAITAGVDANRQRAFFEFGYSLGLAFQVQDDLLGIWGNTATLGKSTESDLVTRKKSLPIAYALENGKEFFHRWQAGPIQPQDVPSLVALLEQEGARTFAQSHADRLTRAALDYLKQAAPMGSAGEALQELTHQLLNRAA
jgi:geranylgeranyl diphosphate synthase type I